MKKLFFIPLFFVLLISSVLAVTGTCGDNTCTDQNGNEVCAQSYSWIELGQIISYDRPSFPDGHKEVGDNGGIGTGVYQGSTGFLVNVKPVTETPVVSTLGPVVVTIDPLRDIIIVKIDHDYGYIEERYTTLINTNTYYNVIVNEESEDFRLKVSLNGVLIDSIDYSSFKNHPDATSKFSDDDSWLKGRLFGSHNSMISAPRGAHRFSINAPEGGEHHVSEYRVYLIGKFHVFSVRDGTVRIPASSNFETQEYVDAGRYVLCGNRVISSVEYDIAGEDIYTGNVPEPVDNIVVEGETIPVYEEKESFFRYMAFRIINYVGSIF